ncbi:MAG: glycoside hydrolase family 9 protein [Acetatifactor sp.]|nr:glycoside hydrolase family 9 protein [Acetatifactor sp.]
MENFGQELIESCYIHKPLTYIPENSFENFRKKEKVLDRKVLWTGEKELSAETEGECWPEGMAQDGDYAFYGNISMELSTDRENWEKYDRLRFVIRPECDGVYVTEVTVGLWNDGVQKIPDAYGREGSHVVTLRNHEWNDCIWEFGSMPRDAVIHLSFAFRRNGREASGGERILYRVKEISLEQTGHRFRDFGWKCDEGAILYPATGYMTSGKKTAVTAIRDEVFYIVSDDTLTVSYKGEPRKVLFDNQDFYVLDFSELKTPGRYHINIGDKRTPMFVIDENVCEAAIWKSINFLFCERCGYPVRGRHGICHMDVVARHQGKILPFCGGWHDAGDLSQQMTHTAESVDALLSLAYSKGPGLEGSMLKERLVEEAIWGLEFVLRTRFEDGYRATSAGLVRWTKGYIGDSDDVEARVHNHAVENLFGAAICAHAAQLLKEDERELAHRCRQAAIKDFEFAIKRLEEAGMELPVFWEHTYGLCQSQCDALVVIASSRLYALTGQETYRNYLQVYVKKVLACQETDEKLPVCGCFYTDESKKCLIHSSHQSREYLCVEALTLCYEFLSDAQAAGQVKKAVLLYGKYLNLLMENANPYGMIPAGIYHEREVRDKENFSRIHLLAEFEQEKEHYLNQLRAGKNMGDGYYLRQFPVWFSFRGNSAISLSLGRAAGMVGHFLNDDSYLDMAREQLYWMNGKNPFGQSLQYGEGSNYASQYAPLPGEMIGEMPVGIQTREDEDEPYWPHTNNATYKEVWTSTTNRWLWVLAEVLREDEKK